MKKGAIYARYSSDKQNDDTIHVQVDKCKAFCEQESILVCEEFVDKGRSGTTEGGREAYQEMLEKARQGLFDVIITYKFDRIGRSFVETVRSIHELETYYSVEIKSATEADDPLVRNIQLSIAESFSRQLGERITDSLASNAKRGFHCGGRAPYGYIKINIDDPDGRTDHQGNILQHVVFECHTDEAPVIQRIFHAYADGLGLKRIAKSLNNDGIISPGGGTWDTSAIYQILRNEAYLGWRVWNKTKKIRKPDGKRTKRVRPREEWKIKKDAHEAIVDTELWENVQQARKRQKALAMHKGGDRTATSSYLLTGIIKCTECGGNFLAHRHKGKNPNRLFYYYRCSYHNRRGNAVCTNKIGVRLDRLEGAVLDLFKEEILTKKNVAGLVKGFQKAWKEMEQDNPDQDLKCIEQDLKKTDRELANLVQAIKSMGFSEALRDELESGEQRKATLEHTKLALQQRRPQALFQPSEQVIAAALGNLSEVLESGKPRHRKVILEDNIEEILIDTTGKALLKVNPAGLLPLPDLRCVHTNGAEGGTRTHTPLRIPDFESDASTSSATSAQIQGDKVRPSPQNVNPTNPPAHQPACQ